MRDVVLTLTVLGLLPVILTRPWIGILVWTWLGFMNPHRAAWGFSTSIPFAMIVAITTLFAIMISREPKRFSRQPEIILLLVFLLWMFVTTLNAYYPAEAWDQLAKVSKIFFMIFVATLVINTKERLIALVWVMALSIGFYGVKGGVFTVLTGGGFHVRGPDRSFIGGNNEIGLALCMTIPLLYYLRQIAPWRWLKVAMLASVLLCVVAILGTQSRGALVGLVAMGAFLWLKSRQKFQIALLIAVSVIVLVPVMPEEWTERMRTIQTYQEDSSAMQRLNAWGMGFNMARSRFLGGGFESFETPQFEMYAPDPTLTADAHSIYFEVLGEHGFPGLAIFLAIAIVTWLSASKVARACKGEPELEWLRTLMAMTQVSLVAYLMAGAFLGLAYFDYYYSLVLVVVVAKEMLRARATVPTGASRLGGNWPVNAGPDRLVADGRTGGVSTRPSPGLPGRNGR